LFSRCSNLVYVIKIVYWGDYRSYLIWANKKIGFAKIHVPKFSFLSGDDYYIYFILHPYW
jgi:hypothetical protein